MSNEWWVMSDEWWMMKTEWWVMDDENWVMSDHFFKPNKALVFNSIFIIKPTYPAVMFDKWTDYFYFYFIFGETQLQLLKLKNGWWVKVPNGVWEIEVF